MRPDGLKIAAESHGGQGIEYPPAAQKITESGFDEKDRYDDFLRDAISFADVIKKQGVLDEVRACTVDDFLSEKALIDHLRMIGGSGRRLTVAPPQEFLDFADHDCRIELHLGTGKKGPHGRLVKAVSDQTVNEGRPLGGNQRGQEQEGDETKDRQDLWRTAARDYHPGFVVKRLSIHKPQGVVLPLSSGFNPQRAQASTRNDAIYMLKPG